MLKHPVLRPLVLCHGLGNLFLAVPTSLFVVYYVRELHLTAATIEWMLAGVNVGLVLGAWANGPLVRRLGAAKATAYTAAPRRSCSPSHWLLAAPR